MTFPKDYLRRLYLRGVELAHDENGATAIEYGLIIAGISIAILATVFAIGAELNDMFSMIGSRMNSRFSTGF